MQPCRLRAPLHSSWSATLGAAPSRCRPPQAWPPRSKHLVPSQSSQPAAARGDLGLCLGSRGRRAAASVGTRKISRASCQKAVFWRVCVVSKVPLVPPCSHAGCELLCTALGLHSGEPRASLVRHVARHVARHVGVAADAALGPCLARGGDSSGWLVRSCDHEGGVFGPSRVGSRKFLNGQPPCAYFELGQYAQRACTAVQEGLGPS